LLQRTLAACWASAFCFVELRAEERNALFALAPRCDSDHLTTYDQWLETQNGRGDPSGQRFDPVPRYIRNGRDLGEFVHRDFSYQAPDRRPRPVGPPQTVRQRSKPRSRVTPRKRRERYREPSGFNCDRLREWSMLNVGFGSMLSKNDFANPSAQD
jgi:hypothetical protein